MTTPSPAIDHNPTRDIEATTGRHRLTDRSWFDLAEQTMHSWPITLRLVVLILALTTGTTAVIAALGLAGQLALAGLAIRGRRERQQRVRALHAQYDTTRKPNKDPQP